MTAEDFVKLLDGVRQTAQGWTASCPAHDDSNPSLSISVGNDGRVLLHCHAGCTIAEICEALDLHFRDLFPAQSTNPKVRRNAVRKRERERDKQRRQRAYQDVRIDLLRESEGLIRSAKGINISAWSPERLNQELNRLADAYGKLEEEDNV
jgi:hypothetical protein